jgi:hypothetical protein
LEQIFDLLGDPVPDGWGKRGRPQHIATHQNRNKVIMLLAFGWSNERIAKALGITPPTLRKNYFRELRIRDEARDRVDAALATMLWKQAKGGSVAAVKEFRALAAENDLMAGHRSFYGVRDQIEQKEPPKLGKKAEAAIAAETAGADTEWGDDLRVSSKH